MNEEKRKFLRLLLVAFAVIFAYIFFGKSNDYSSHFRSILDEGSRIRVDDDTLVVG